MVDSSLEAATRALVYDYVFYKLHSRGYEWSGCPPLDLPNSANFATRSLADEFEARYKDHFDGMCLQLHLTPSTCYPTFTGVVNELFSEGISWGKVIALLSFVGALAVRCVEKEMAQYVDSVAGWAVQYIEENLANWIAEQGGWDGLVKFYNQGFDRNLGNKGSYMGMAVFGLLTLGALMASRS